MKIFQNSHLKIKPLNEKHFKLFERKRIYETHTLEISIFTCLFQLDHCITYLYDMRFLSNKKFFSLKYFGINLILFAFGKWKSRFTYDGGEIIKYFIVPKKLNFRFQNHKQLIGLIKPRRYITLLHEMIVKTDSWNRPLML